MTERELLIRKIASTDFAAEDLHLFLDSHPENEEIMKKMNEFRAKSDEYRKEYSEKFGPLQTGAEEKNRFSWISGPWPWENPERSSC